MADNKKRMKHSIFSMQPDIENLFELTPENFVPATDEQKNSATVNRESVSYGKDTWRRMKRSFVSMAALGVIIFLFLFAFVGPAVVPYGYV
ncbi:MAG: ABC transporter permease, partial [Clostridia bacterium]|nr:ABC transporter permease [Clostridia bacterium]